MPTWKNQKNQFSDFNFFKIMISINDNDINQPFMGDIE